MVDSADRISAANRPAHGGLGARPAGPPRSLLVRAGRKQDGDEVSVALEDVSELRRLRRIRREFIDNLSHELRTPLTTMRLLAESLALEAKRRGPPARVGDAVA